MRVSVKVQNLQHLPAHANRSWMSGCHSRHVLHGGIAGRVLNKVRKSGSVSRIFYDIICSSKKTLLSVDSYIQTAL